MLRFLPLHDMSALSLIGTLLSGILVTLVLTFFARKKAQYRKMPPQPPGSLPIIGHLAQLRPEPAEVIRKWRGQVGDTFLVRFGPKDLVVMHNYDTAKAVLSDDNTTGRDADHLLNLFSKSRGLQQAEKTLWQDHRRFITRTLRDNGMGKNILQEGILAEVDDLMLQLARYSETPVNPRPFLTHLAASVVSVLICGKRFPHTDKLFREYSTIFGKFVRLLAPLMPVYLYRFLKHVPPFKKHYTEYVELWKFAMSYAGDMTQTKRDEYTWDPNDLSTKCYIDSYFDESNRLREQGQIDNSFKDDQLLFSVINMYTAGTETSSITILWCLVYMTEMPEVRRRVQQEIDSVVGPDSLVRLEDRPRLKYCDAVLLEVQRCASIVPMGLFHRCYEDMVIDGYEIPAGTLLAANTYGMHHDERYWKDPQAFNPDRFLDEEGNLQVPKGWCPFNVGKRQCNGEPLAKMEMYLVLTNLMHRFDIVAPAQDGPNSKEYEAGMHVRCPHPFKLLFKPRTYST